MNRYQLYTLCAQTPARDVRALLALSTAEGASRNTPPRILGEDFCGAAELSRAWCEHSTKARAIAADRDPEAIAHARPHPRLRLLTRDVFAVKGRIDVLAALNFSVCELHERRELVRYLKHVRARLNPGGCFVCDIYGGRDAFATGTVSQRFKGPRGESVTYRWQQRDVDPLAARVVNAMHFSVRTKRGVTQTFSDAFVYHWRLWTVAELRDAMLDAGFRSSSVYSRTADAIDQDGNLYFSPIDEPSPLAEGFNVFVVARV